MNEHTPVKSEVALFEHAIGAWVHLDGDPTLRYRVVGIQIYERGNQFLCAWVKPSGDHDERWFDGWRLTRLDR